MGNECSQPGYTPRPAQGWPVYFAYNFLDSQPDKIHLDPNLRSLIYRKSPRNQQDEITLATGQASDVNDLSRLSAEQIKLLEEGEIIGDYGHQITMLHFRKFHERRGIGEKIISASHMALTVTDIGVSASFYADVLGLPQIERPNFDRHGAWFTAGNLELHLIKGQAFVPTGEDLIVPHLALETLDVDACIKKLQEMDPPVQFQLNVSVATDDGKGVVKQIFLRDPDGYYIEVGQTHVLTKFCLGHKKYDAYANYNNHSGMLLNSDYLKVNMGTYAFFQLSRVAKRAKKRMANRKELRVYVTNPHYFDPETVVVDQKILDNMKARIKRFGDFFNGLTEEDIVGYLKKYNNYAPDVCLAIIEKIELTGFQEYNPPDYYDNKVDRNEGQNFEMLRQGKGFSQKKFYKPGDELFRYEVLVEDQEKIVRRVHNMEQAAVDADIRGKISSAKQKMEEAIAEFKAVSELVAAQQANSLD